MSNIKCYGIYNLYIIIIRIKCIIYYHRMTMMTTQRSALYHPVAETTTRSIELAQTQHTVRQLSVKLIKLKMKSTN